MPPPSAGTTSPHCPGVLSNRLPTALSLLADALAYANDVAGDPWEFAVSMAELSAVGVTAADCRWLNRKGYIDARTTPCARATPRSGTNGRRRTAARGALSITPATWFVLTPQGNELLRSFQRGEAALAVAAALDNMHAAQAAARPRWDADRRELWLGAVLIKRFRVPAENQEIILAVFEESDWPDCIEDPLPPKPELDSKRRLHDAIRALNRSQRHPRIVFFGNGNGWSIRWRLAEKSC